jgi:hypothetical protein
VTAFPDPGHVNGFYLGQFFGLLGWSQRQADYSAILHPLEGFEPSSSADMAHLARLLTPWLDSLTEAQDAALARTWAYAVSEFDDRDLSWFLLGHLPALPDHPRAFLSDLAVNLYPQGLPEVNAQMQRLDRETDSLFDLA